MKRVIKLIREKRGLAVLVLLVMLPVLVWGAGQVRRWLSRAVEPNVTLSFSPNAASLPGDQTLDVVVNTGSEGITGADVEFTFDQTKVQLAGEAQVTGQLSQVLVQTTAVEANATGRVRLVLGLPLTAPTPVPASGTVVLARVTFHAVTTANTTTSVDWNLAAAEVVNGSGTILTVGGTGATLTLNPAGGGVTLSFSPDAASLPGDQTLDVVVNTGSEGITGVDVEFTFDQTKVQLAGEAQITGQLNQVLVQTTAAEANATGRVRLVLGLPLTAPTPVPASGTVVLARVTFHAVTTANTTTSVDWNLAAAEVVNGVGAVLTVGGTGATLALNAAAVTNTPTLTVTGVPTPTQVQGQLVLTVTPGCNQNALTWTGGTGQLYDIDRCIGAGCSPTRLVSDLGALTYNDTGLTNGVTYVYRVGDAETDVMSEVVSAVPGCGMTPTPTPIVVVDSFTFKVRLQGITQKAGDQSITVLFKQNGQTVQEAGLVGVNDNAGVYAIQVVVTPGTYDICLKGRSHLQRCMRSVVITAPPQTVNWSADQQRQLLVGDVNNSNSITIEDVVAVLAKYTDFSVPVPAGTPEDVNADGRITIDDVALTLINFTDFNIAGDN